MSFLSKLFGKKEPEPEKEPLVEEFMNIGGSPMPGITLRRILDGHTGPINHMSWSPDGHYLASSSNDGTIRVWDLMGQGIPILLEGHNGYVNSIVWSPDGKMLASGSNDGTIRIWIVQARTVPAILSENTPVIGVAWSPNGMYLAASSHKDIQVWDWKKRQKTLSLGELDAVVTSLFWDPTTNKLIASTKGKLLSWNPEDWSKSSIGSQGGTVGYHDGKLSYDGKILAAGSTQHQVVIFDPKNLNTKLVVEGHTDVVFSISFSRDGSLLASKSIDNTIRLWETKTWTEVAATNESVSSRKRIRGGLAFHPKLPILASLGNSGTIIRIWSTDNNILVRNKQLGEAIRYTTAKIVLVGDSGVGKTGLGWRLAHNEFKEHSSTHGQQFWVIPELGNKRKDGTECEAVLWDLAGQHNYRTIHSIFLDNVDASLILFDASDRQIPLKGVEFWLNQLAGKNKLPPSILIGARSDVSPTNLSMADLEQFCQRYGITGGYISVSAKTGQGLKNLLYTIKNQIPWEQMAATVTTFTFKRIKDYVLTLKEKLASKENKNIIHLLVHPNELREQLQNTDKTWQFSNAEMMTAVGHLETHGYISILKSSSGDEYILLAPDLLVNLASSIVSLADKNPRELGAISETELLQGKYKFNELNRLKKEEEQILLDAAVLRFLEHSICFRETLEDDILLIFPGLIKQKRPLYDDLPSTDDISYIVRGKVENIYATLVVLLGYTPSFTRINQWQNQAQYETENGNVCGFRLIEDREGEIELILYYGNVMPQGERNEFQTLFEQFLYQRDVEVTPFPPVLCPNKHRQERATVVKRLREDKKSVFCDECGAPTDLPRFEAQKSIGINSSNWLKREEGIARLRNTYETYLARIKGYRRGWAVPRCYISHIEDQKDFAKSLEHYLGDAGIFIINNVSQVESNDMIVIIDSQSYKKAWEDHTISDEINLVKTRLADSGNKGLIAINQSGNISEHDIIHCVSSSFCDPTHYVVNLFDLILNLYSIPLSHAGFTPLRKLLHEQWEQTLAQNIIREGIIRDTPSKSKREVFLSYAWSGESENIVNEIDQAFQKRGVTIIRDKRDLAYKGSIKEFMERIGRGQGVVVVISDKYMRSKSCMFELIQIAENKQFKDRIFPVVLSDVNMFDAIKRIEYVKYWENKRAELDAAIKTVGSENLQGIREEVDLFDNIRDAIAKLTNTLQDMNALTADIHSDSNFQVLFDTVMAKLEE